MSTVRHTIVILADLDAPAGVDVQAFVDRWCQDVRCCAVVGIADAHVGLVAGGTVEDTSVAEIIGAFRALGSIGGGA